MDMTIPAIILLLITLSPVLFILFDDRQWDRVKPKDSATSEDDSPSAKN